MCSDRVVYCNAISTVLLDSYALCFYSSLVLPFAYVVVLLDRVLNFSATGLSWNCMSRGTV